MSQRVVDHLEPVQIEHADGKWLPVLHGLFKLLHEQHAVGDARERIVGGLALQLQVGRGQGAVALLQHLHRISKLAPSVLQAQPQAAAESAEGNAAAQRGHEAQPDEATFSQRALRRGDALIQGRHQNFRGHSHHDQRG
jgi:hypothetical protein